MIHLDTSFLIRALVPASAQDGKLREWLSRGKPLGISSIGWTELLCGPMEPEHLELARVIVPQRLPFTEDEAALAARLFNLSGRRRGSLVDCMIAATAIRHDAELATANPQDFNRLTSAGLKLVDV